MRQNVLEWKESQNKRQGTEGLDTDNFVSPRGRRFFTCRATQKKKFKKRHDSSKDLGEMDFLANS